MLLRRLIASTLALACTAIALPLVAWHAEGHERPTRAAVIALKGKVPEFFTADPDAQAHFSVDPDVFKHRRAAPRLTNAEYSEHFIDLEFLEGDDLPPNRYAFLEYCVRKEIDPTKVGLAPYAIAEWTERLILAFAEHRKWPDNPYIKQKAVVYAGILAHYAQDMCHPLHTTVHYDGRVAKPGDPSPRTGIHLKTDALTGKLPIEPAVIARSLEPEAFDDLFKAIVAELKKSHALVDRVYELEGQYPELRDPIRPGTPVWEFTEERLKASAAFTASLYLTAWEKSKTVEFPDYHKR